MFYSKYNTVFSHDDNILLYNSISNSFMEISEDLLDLIQNKQVTEKDFGKDEKEIFHTLVHARVLVDDDSTELLKLKRYIHSSRHNSSYASFTILPTLNCNFSCPYCFENKKQTKLTDENIDKICKLVNRVLSKTDGCHLTWFGGEPLLEIKKMEKLYNKIDSRGKTIHSSIITNGYLLTKPNISILKRMQVSDVQVTLDGLEGTHNKRKFLFEKHTPTFQKTVENIINLLKANFATVAIRVNLDENNKDEFVPLYQYLSCVIPNFGKNMYVYPAFINNYNNAEICQNNNICHLSHDKQIDFIYKLYEKYGYMHSAIYPTNILYECPIRHLNSWVIAPDATLYKCWEIAGDKDFEVGYINEDGVPIITNEQAYFRYLEGADPLTDEVCMACHLYPVCGGGCIQARIKNMYFNDTVNHCIFAKDNIEGFLKIYYNQYKKTATNEK